VKFVLAFVSGASTNLSVPVTQDLMEILKLLLLNWSDSCACVSRMFYCVWGSYSTLNVIPAFALGEELAYTLTGTSWAKEKKLALSTT